MEVKTLKRWVGTAGSGPETRLRHWFLRPPYGYVLGIVLWPLFLLSLSAWAVLLQAGLPPIAVTAGSLVVVGGGALLTILSSALLLSVTAWNTPYELLRRQFATFVLSLLLGGLLFGVYLAWPLFPYRDELGLSVFVAHELSKIVFAGTAIGFIFMLFPLLVLASRYRFK